MLSFRVLPLVAAVVVAGLLALPSAGDARAQTAGDVYDGRTADGRLLRLVVSDDATQVFVQELADPEGVTCGAGHIDRFIRSTTAPIIGDQFEISLLLSEFGQRSEPTSLATEVTITGDFVSPTRVEGSYRAIRTEDPACDSGLVAWSGKLVFNKSAVVPLGGPTFSGRASQGMLVEFTLAPERDFIVDFRVGDLSFGPAECPGITSSIPSIGTAWPQMAEPVTAGKFEFFRTFVVAETSPAWTHFVTGAFISETQAEGTIRLIVVDQPECDTGVLTWTATAPPPPPSPTPSPEPGGLPAGGTVPPQGDASSVLWLAIGSGALVVGALAVARSFLRLR